MSTDTHDKLDTSNEGHLLARKFFVLTTIGVVAFCTVVALVVTFAPSNGGEVPNAAPVRLVANR